MSVSPSVDRPDDLFARSREWSDLSAFATADTPGLRIGIVSGRRRQGKSFLLRRLVNARAGLYHQAQEVERAQALARFADDVADHLELPPGTLRFADWEDALRLALGQPRDRAGTPRGRAASIVVLDEFPYLLAHSPELPSVIQGLYDEAQDRHGASSALVVCGSALSVMTDIVSGTKPLRGRAQLNMTIGPFDFRVARDYWGIDDPQVAFRIDAVLGGTAGYRPLIAEPPPVDVAGIRPWLAASVLNPAHALFDETDYLLREDPRIRDKAAYNSVLAAIAAGRHRLKDIGAFTARTAQQLKHPLDVLESAGFVFRVEDMLVDRRPTYHLSDPIVRFAEAVIAPHFVLLEERDTATVWQRAAPTLSAQVLGPHLEQMSRTWAARYASAELGVEIGDVGPAVVHGAEGRAQHEIDVFALAAGGRRRDKDAPVAMLGEAKSTNSPRVVADLARLDAIRQLLVARGYDAAGALLVVFGRSGFDAGLVRAAATRSDVRLVDLAALYGA